MENTEVVDSCVVAVVVVNYKTPKLLVTCLQSLEKERMMFPNMNVFIVDNASPDNSITIIQQSIQQYKWGSWVKLIAAKKNGGYAYGNNIGFAAAKEALRSIDFFWMLNPDTRVLPGATAALINSIKEKPNEIVGSCLQDEDGTKQVSAFNFPSIVSELCAGFGLGLLDRLFSDYVVVRDIPCTAEQVDWLAGASLMFSASTQDNLDNLDDAFFLYYEEVDYLLKANRMGIKCRYVPDSHVIHEVGAATGISDTRNRQPRRPSYWFESRRYYFIKNYSRLYLLAADTAWILGYTSWCFRKSITSYEQLRQQPPGLLIDFILHSSWNPFSWFR